jgi:hypothetical protein
MVVSTQTDWACSSLQIDSSRIAMDPSISEANSLPDRGRTIRARSNITAVRADASIPALLRPQENSNHDNHPRPSQFGYSEIVSSPGIKNIPVFISPDSLHINSIPSRSEGRWPSSQRGTGRGGRRCHERRAWLRRTAKSCGPDAPMLASSSWEVNACQERRWQESPFTGENSI